MNDRLGGPISYEIMKGSRSREKQKKNKVKEYKWLPGIKRLWYDIYFIKLDRYIVNFKNNTALMLYIIRI